jgi:hypothetical protein
MKRRSAARQSLLGSADLVGTYTNVSDVSPAPSGRSSNISQSDREWIQLQQSVDENRQLAATAQQSIQGLVSGNDEAFMNAAQLREVIQRKETENERGRVNALSIQEKFIWDLSFALKRCLVEEKGSTTLEGIAVSQLPVQSILECAETEDPQPENWSRWIEDKFRQQTA